MAEIVGLGKACEIAHKNLKEHMQHLKGLRDYYIDQIHNKVPGAVLNGDIINRLPGNANFSFPSIDGEELLFSLDAKGICASAGSACSAGSSEPSHVLTSIGLSNDLANKALRISFGEENTEEDVDFLIKSICEVMEIE